MANSEAKTRKTAGFKAFSENPVVRNVFIFLSLAVALFLLMSEEGARMQWPYMIITYMLAAGVYKYEMSRSTLKTKPTLLGYLFPRDIWLHRSAIHDYAVIIINYILIITVLELMTFEQFPFHVITQKIIGMLPVSGGNGSPGVIVIGMYTLAAFSMSDLFYYLMHRLQHEIPLLWEFHKVHHSAKVLTPATLHRAHPLDVWMSAGARTIGLGIASGVFYYFYPTLEGVMTIAGVNAFTIFSYVIGANLRHSHIWLSFGRPVEHVIMSPAQHQIHHSEKPSHYDKNYGSFFSLWDWLGNTIYIPEGREDLTFGLGSTKEEEPLNTVWGLYISPFQKAWHIIAGTSPKP